MSLQTQYRENFNFTFDRLETSIETLKTFDEAIKKIHYARIISGPFHTTLRDFIQQAIQEFVSYLEDDFSIQSALVVVFSTISTINRRIEELGLAE